MPEPTQVRLRLRGRTLTVAVRRGRRTLPLAALTLPALVLRRLRLLRAFLDA